MEKNLYMYECPNCGSNLKFDIAAQKMLCSYCSAAVYKVITSSYANTITDNVYHYASDGDYYDCAAQAYAQILTLLKGHKIAQPMKYISNALLVLILALLLNYGLVSFFTGIRKPHLQSCQQPYRLHNQKYSPHFEVARF